MLEIEGNGRRRHKGTAESAPRGISAIVGRNSA